VVGAALRPLIQVPTGMGELSGPDVRSARAENAACGDRLELFVRCAGDRVEEVRYRATACPATVAVAELATRSWPGQRWVPDALRTLVRAEAERLGGLSRTEQHALDLLDQCVGLLAPEKKG
jgi:NifU-like protein involved in Fe-S cluster formation